MTIDTIMWLIIFSILIVVVGVLLLIDGATYKSVFKMPRVGCLLFVVGVDSVVTLTIVLLVKVFTS